MTTNNERVHHYSLMAYMVMLALLVPLTVFLAQQEQVVQSKAVSQRISPTPFPTPTISVMQQTP